MYVDVGGFICVGVVENWICVGGFCWVIKGDCNFRNFVIGIVVGVF